MDVAVVVGVVDVVTPSKHICYARAMWLFVEVAMDAVKDFSMRKYNI